MKEKGTAPYDQAIAILCPRIREILDRIPTQIKAQIQEIRLRSCQPVLLIGLNGTGRGHRGGEAAAGHLRREGPGGP